MLLTRAFTASQITLLISLSCYLPLAQAATVNIGDSVDTCGNIGLSNTSYNRIANRTEQSCGAYRIKSFSYSIDAVLASTTMEYYFHAGSAFDSVNQGYYDKIPSGTLITPNNSEQTSLDSAQGTAGQTGAGRDVLISHTMASDNVIFDYNTNTEYWIEARANPKQIQICYANSGGPDSFGRDEGSPVHTSYGRQNFIVNAEAISPVITSETVENSISDNQFSASLTATRDSTLYWVLVSTSTPKPSPSQVKAGTDANGNSPISSGNVTVNANTAKNIVIDGLSAKTQYNLYVVGENDYLGCVPNQLAVTTEQSNSAPVITSAAVNTATEDSAYTYTLTASDEDTGDTVSLSATTLPSWLTFNEETGVLSGTPTNDHVGTHNVVLVATDSDNATDTQSFTVTVSNTNDAPEITSIAVTAATEDSAYTYTLTASDEDTGDTVSLSATTLPSWLTFNEETGVLSGTPTNDHIGTHNVVLVATDSSDATDTQSFTITVSNTNDAPLISGTPSTLVYAGVPYEFVPTISDVDGDTLAVSASDLPEWLTLNTSSGALTGTPSVTDAGVIAIELVVSDGIAQATLPEFELTVRVVDIPSVSLSATGIITSLNQAQLLGLAANASAAEQAQALNDLFATAGSDLANDIQITDMNNGQLNLKPGRHQVEWVLIGGAKVVQQVDVWPLVSLAPDQLVFEGSQVPVTAILNGEAPSYPVTVPFVIGDQSTASTEDHNLVAGEFVFEEATQEGAVTTEVEIVVSITADDVPEANETLVVTLQESEQVSLGAKFNQQITITEENVAPQVSLSVTQNNVATIEATPDGGDITVQATVVDPNDEDTHSYRWQLNNGAKLDSDGDDTLLTIDPSTLSFDAYRVVVEVTDNAGARRSESIFFKVVAETTELSSASDQDGDGVNDAQEGAGDTDGDGIPDYLDAIAERNILQQVAVESEQFLVECQPGVKCNLGANSLLSEKGGARLSDADIANNDALLDDEFFTNTGTIVDFEIKDLPTVGQSVQVVVPQRQAIPAGAVYRKFINGAWRPFVEDAYNALHSAPGQLGVCPPPGGEVWQPGLVEGHYCVQLTLQDGGANDADGIDNGAIVDPGGVSTANVVEVSGSTTQTGAFNPMLWVMFLLMIVANRRGGRA